MQARTARPMPCALNPKTPLKPQTLFLCYGKTPASVPGRLLPARCHPPREGPMQVRRIGTETPVPPSCACTTTDTHTLTMASLRSQKGPVKRPRRACARRIAAASLAHTRAAPACRGRGILAVSNRLPLWRWRCPGIGHEALALMGCGLVFTDAFWVRVFQVRVCAHLCARPCAGAGGGVWAAPRARVQRGRGAPRHRRALRGRGRH